VQDFLKRLEPQARAAIADFLSAAVIGAADTVLHGFTQLASATGADEFMLVSDVFDPALRLRSIGIAAEVVKSCAAGMQANQESALVAGVAA